MKWLDGQWYIAYYFAIQGSSLGENFLVVNGVC